MEVYRLSGAVHHLISISRCYDLFSENNWAHYLPSYRRPFRCLFIYSVGGTAVSSPPERNFSKRSSKLKSETARSSGGGIIHLRGRYGQKPVGLPPLPRHASRGGRSPRRPPERSGPAGGRHSAALRAVRPRASVQVSWHLARKAKSQRLAQNAIISSSSVRFLWPLGCAIFQREKVGY